MASTINSNTTDGVVITSDTSGELKLQSGGTDIATVKSTGLEMASGKNLVTTAPAFRAYLNADQTNISSSTWTKLNIDTEEFDTSSDFASSRFTPSVAGYYQINGRVRFNSTGTRTLHLAGLYKNGGLYSYGNSDRTSTSSDMGVVVSDLIYFNGTTDYLELYGYAAGTTYFFQGGQTYNCYLSASLARAV